MSTEKYIDLIGVINTAVRGQSGTVVQFGSTSDLDRREVLAWLDRNPDQVPGRTITESESKYLFDIARQGLRYWPNALDRTGITVIPDPEPTNAEKLETEIRELFQEPSQSFSIARDLAEKLDKAGWTKAPGGDDD